MDPRPIAALRSGRAGIRAATRWRRIHPVKPTNDWYNREGDVYLVEIALSHPRQLFNSLDPSPFIEKDLDDDAEAYIVDSVREFSLGTPLKLVFYVPTAERADLGDSLAEAVHNYFEYKEQVAGKELRFTIRQGRIALLIGISFLVFCLSLREAVGALESTFWTEIVAEGLLISGWVAMWRPIEIFLYTWWPTLRMRRVYQKLRNMQVEIRSR